MPSQCGRRKCTADKLNTFGVFLMIIEEYLSSYIVGQKRPDEEKKFNHNM